VRARLLRRIGSTGNERAVAQDRDVTLPRWFAASGGFLVERNRTRVWTGHVDYVAETFGDLTGGWPPGHDDAGEWALAGEAIQLASAEAALRRKQTGLDRWARLVPHGRPETAGP
jgi:hypothetical protein